MYRSSAHYGWQPDLPDFRDFKYGVRPALTKKLPQSVDLRNGCPPIYDQGQLGSCTANAIAAAFEYDLIKQNAPDFLPSRLFIYYNERSIENTINTDSGAQIRDGIKSIAKLGVCPETQWPYIPSEFAHKPYLECYQSALNHKTLTYEKLARDQKQICACIADGYPVVIGFTVYDYFESNEMARKGILKMPAAGESVVGGHAVLIVGYDNAQQGYIVRNSWGKDWGLKGYFIMPYEYLLHPDLANDFWTIRVVESNPALSRPGHRNTRSGLLPKNKNVREAIDLALETKTARLTVTFTDVATSEFTATCNGSSKTINQSGIISFNNVSPNDLIEYEGSSAGTTKISIDIKADPMKIVFNPGDIITGTFLILAS